MQVLEDVQESEASLPSPSKRSPQVNKVGEVSHKSSLQHLGKSIICN